MKNSTYGEYIAETIGTFIFVLLGLASVAILIVTETGLSYGQMALVWGLGVALGIYITGYVSGAHLNPAVTISLAVWGKFPKKKVIPYVLSQLVGAFLAALVVYVAFRSSIINYELTNNIVRGTIEGRATSGIFATSAGANVSLINAFFVEFVITMILMLVIYSVTDQGNGGAPTSGFGAVIIGITVTICGMAFGPLTGFAMNPARDLGPRLFTMISGWGTNALGDNLYGLIVPIFAPILGAIVAGLIYFKWIVPNYPKSEL